MDHSDPNKRRVKTNLNEIEGAFESNDMSFEMKAFLDLETGEVVLVNGETQRLLEKIDETHADPETGQVDWQKVMPLLSIPDWQKQDLLSLIDIQEGEDERFISIPQMTAHEAHQDMKAFIETVPNSPLKSRLEEAIAGKGAFRQFKSILSNSPRDRERWFQFKNKRMRERVLAWLASKGIEPLSA